MHEISEPDLRQAIHFAVGRVAFTINGKRLPEDFLGAISSPMRLSGT